MSPRLLACAACLAAAALAGAAAAEPVLRIGLVIPSKTGEMRMPSSLNDFTGEAARFGAGLADAEVVEWAAGQGLRVEVLLANAPYAEAAERAARRLVHLEHVQALVGGIGEGQAEILSAIAGETGTLFLNIGSTSDALRGAACDRMSFHVEASASMYIDAMARLGADGGARSWFVVHEPGEEGRGMMAAAERAIAASAPEAAVIGDAEVERAAPVYSPAIRSAAGSGADRVMLLLDPLDQMVFLEQAEALGLAIPVAAFPHTLGQTRNYVAAARYNAPSASPRRRIALWEATLPGAEAEAFNEAFHARAGVPADPTAWASYASIRILAEAALAAGDTAPEALAAYLEDSDTRLDALKGPGLSFRPWDHQLRQPLYAIRVDPEATWSHTSLADQIATAAFEAPIPDPAGADDPAAALDVLGQGAAETACRF